MAISDDKVRIACHMVRVEGQTLAAAAKAIGVNPRTIARWNVPGGRFDELTAKLETEISATTEEFGAAPPESAYRRTWSPRELEEIGFPAYNIPSLKFSLEMQARLDNWRLHEWVWRLKQADPMQEEWKFTVAFLPILARDIEAPALAALARLMVESFPWQSNQLRRTYARKAAPVLYEAMHQIAQWSMHSGLKLGFSQRRGQLSLSKAEWDSARMIEELALGARPLYGIPEGHSYYPMDRVESLLNTPYGVLLGFIPRLPNIDMPSRLAKRQRELLSISTFVATWCQIVTDEWCQAVRAANERVWSIELAEEDSL